MHVSEDDAVISDRHAGALADADAVHHLSGIEHAAAAVDHEIKLGKIVRERIAGRPLKVEVFTGCPGNYLRKLHGSDIVALTMVCAPLRNQDMSTIFKRIQCFGRKDRFTKISFVSSKQHGE